MTNGPAFMDAVKTFLGLKEREVHLGEGLKREELAILDEMAMATRFAASQQRIANLHALSGTMERMGRDLNLEAGNFMRTLSREQRAQLHSDAEQRLEKSRDLLDEAAILVAEDPYHRKGTQTFPPPM